MILAQINTTYLFLAIIIGLLIGMLLSKRGKVDKNKIAVLKTNDFMDMKRKGTLVDTRKKDLYDQGKIVGAKNLTGSSGAKSSQVRKDIPIFIYDQDGSKVYSIAKSYVRNNACMVYCLKGGYKTYLEEKK